VSVALLPERIIPASKPVRLAALLAGGMALSAYELANARNAMFPIAALTSAVVFLTGAAVSGGFFILATRGRMRQLQRIIYLGSERARNARFTERVTGLANREAFMAALAEPPATGAHRALLLLDLDGFRRLRTMHGRIGSDAVLCEFSNRLSALVAPVGLAARLQSDEFGVLLHAADEAELLRICQALQAGLQAAYFPQGARWDVSLCIGATLLPLEGGTPDAAMSHAYSALDQAKAAGGGACRLFDPDRAANLQSRNELKADLKAALAAEEFVPYYQPIVALDTGAICGFEVLARWRHSQRGLLQPNEFIPLAEERNLCAQLSLCLLRQVVRDQLAWPQHWRFAFNAAPSQLRELIDFVQAPDQSEDFRIDPSRIDLEVTESALIADLVLARNIVGSMHARGIQVSLDDFGTGYANFLYLREIPFDRIKIDKSFIADMLIDPRCDACVRSMLALAASMGMRVTAEGVETPEQAAYLRALGCSHAQGYLYAKPLSKHEVDCLAGDMGDAAMCRPFPAGGWPPPAAAACSGVRTAYLRPPCTTNIHMLTTRSAGTAQPSSACAITAR
jgi:diguanylate cyclase (GGDEF)-like protein